MKIALIARGCRPGAGIPRYTFELATRLAVRHEVVVITRPGEYAACPAALVPVPSARAPLWRSVLSFSTRAGFVAHQQAYDLVHTQGSDGRWGDVVTAHSCHLAGMRASLRAHPGWVNRLRKFFSLNHRAVVQMERNAFASARALVAVSRQVRRQVRAAYPGTRHLPFHVIYPGVDPEAFAPAALDEWRGETRRRLELAPEQTAFLLVATAPRLKGAERLIRALRALSEPKAVVVIATTLGLEPRLQRLAERLGVGPWVRFLAAGRDPRPAYAACDAYVSLPEYESFGLSILEAMAAGLPVLVTGNAGAVELMKNEREGLILHTWASEASVAAAMRRLLNEPGLRQRLGEAGRRTAGQYTWERMTEALEQVYADVRREKAG
ncbi:MAG: glycosyltransferase family 4 protein [candidate division FCPU426 bacterium]